MKELRCKDTRAFKNFMRMPPKMFDEVLDKLRPCLTKQVTFMRSPLQPGLKLAITLRHLASGAKYYDMRYGWRVPHNTISLIVREVIINLYKLLYLYVGIACSKCSIKMQKCSALPGGATQISK